MSCGRHLFPSTCAQFDRRKTSVLYKPSSSKKMSPSVISLRDLGGIGAIQQIDSYSMDAVLQNFRRSFGSTTLFFHLLSLDPPTTLEELYRQADKYLTLKDNIRAASQTAMITAQSSKPVTKGQPKPKGSKNQKRSRDQSERKREPRQFTPLNISYDRLLPLIWDHPDFEWPKPIQSDPVQLNQYLRCDYHRDHGHETNRCRNLKFMVEKLSRASHLRRYIREMIRVAEAALAVEKIAAEAKLPPKPRPTINYILGGPADDQYQSKCQKKRLLRSATVRALINIIHAPDSSKAVQPIDNPISFPPINSSKVITPHHDALVLYVSMILMCTEYWLTLAARLICYNRPPLGR